MTELLCKEEVYSIIGAAMEVYNQYGSVNIAVDVCHSREGGNPVRASWTPAFAGVT
jgi:hypothetical protein